MRAFLCHLSSCSSIGLLPFTRVPYVRLLAFVLPRRDLVLAPLESGERKRPGLLRRQVRLDCTPTTSRTNVGAATLPIARNGDRMPMEPNGARFYDEHHTDRGWASRVIKRANGVGRLTILDVTTTDRELLGFLRGLDKAPLWIEEGGEGGAHYRFAWASGYENGPTVRVQGNLLGA